jgi:hypothetical protein
MPSPPPEMDEFVDLYRRLEFVLKRTGFLDTKRKRASADWTGFAEGLGEEFFIEVRDSNEAATIIKEPPRVRMRDSMDYEPAVPEPITNVVELFTRGVCQVRHNYEHGEKYFTNESRARDTILTQEASRVLKRAADRLGPVADLLKTHA